LPKQLLKLLVVHSGRPRAKASRLWLLIPSLVLIASHFEIPSGLVELAFLEE
jgi:hypothetical protein